MVLQHAYEELCPPDALYFYPLIGFLLVTYVYAACYITYYVRIFYCSSLTTLRCCVSVSKWIIICSILGLSDRRTAGIHQSIICCLGPWSQWGFGCPSFFILVSATSRHASSKSASSSSSDWRSLRGLPLDYFGLDILGCDSSASASHFRHTFGVGGVKLPM